MGLRKSRFILAAVTLGVCMAAPAWAITTNLTNGADLAAAISGATGGDTINLAAGTYSITSPLSINTPNLTIKGAGAHVTKILNGMASTANPIFMDIPAGATGLIIKDVTIDGNMSQYLSWPANSGTDHKPFYGVNMSGTTNISIQDVTVTGFGKSGVNLNGADHVSLVNITSVQNGGAGVYMMDSQNVTVKNIYTEDNQWGGLGIAVFGKSFPIPTPLNVIVTGDNHFGESGFGKSGMYVESGNYAGGLPAAAASPLEYTDATPSGTPLTCAKDVCYQVKDFAYVSAFYQHDADCYHRGFFRSAADATAFKVATGGIVGIENLAGGVAFSAMFSGPQGAAGSQGAAGPQGATGSQGATGPQGVAGNDGAPGLKGDTGSQGAIGPQGVAGKDGTNGLQGATGSQGAIGPQGVPGNDGAPGLKGDTGPSGATGPSGTSSWTDASGKVTTAQNVGIGTATPGHSLDVQNATGGKVFSVETGTGNDYKMQVMGHTGGSSHAQITTGLTNSRMTVMASDPADYAPRIAFIGPNDYQGLYNGWAMFDYGSSLFNLPDAKFSIRHISPGPIFKEMFSIVGNQTVSFPVGNVGIGTTVPNSRLQVKGYFQLDTVSGIPPSTDCDEAVEYGRMKIDPTANGTLWICTQNGWNGK